MWKKLAVLTVTAASLCGCILESKTPVFAETAAQLVLGETGGTARMLSWKDGAWEADAETPAITVQDHHYQIAAKDGAVSLAFVPVNTTWFAVQGHDGKTNAAYMLAQITDGGADIWPVTCSKLKETKFKSQWIEHRGDDCFITPGAPAKDLFAALAADTQMGHAPSRMEIIR